MGHEAAPRPIIFYITPSNLTLMRGDATNDRNFIRCISAFAPLTVISRMHGQSNLPVQVLPSNARSYHVPAIDSIGTRIISNVVFSFVAAAIVMLLSFRAQRKLIFVRDPLVCLIVMLLLRHFPQCKIIYRTHSAPFLSRELAHFLPPIPKVTATALVWMFKAIDSVALSCSDCVIFASQHEMVTVVKEIEVKSAVWIPLSAPEDFFRATRELGPDSGRALRLGYFGGFETDWNYDCLLNALNGMTDVEIYFAGDGPLKNTVMRKCASMNLRAFFLGRILTSMIPGFLSSVDCVAEGGKVDMEAFDLAITQKSVEALAAGVALITTKQEARNLGLIDGYDCLAFQPGDAHDLRRSILKLVTNRRLSTDIGTHARQHAFSFREDAVAKQYQQLVLKLLC